MNNFGLGLILNFTDNATAGLRGATGAFNDLNSATAAFSQANNAEAALLQVSVAAGIVGNELYQVGESITSLFSSIIKGVTSTGSTILSAKTQLGTLYGSMEAGEAELAKIKDYAATSIFNFEDLIPSVIMLKANGIEAFDQIATSAYEASNGMEGTAQTLMDYASDLAAFNPQMRNAYGTGVQAAMGALNEYIAEGNAISLKRGASLDINQLLGEETGNTIEERSRQVADLIEQLGMVGTTANLASTPMQRLSNVEDTLFNLTAEISNSGVYDKYSELIAKLTDYIFSIPEEELNSIAHTIGSALVEILELLDPVVDMIIEITDSIRNFLKTNPELAKSIIKFTALSGVFTLLTGASLKLLSALGMLRFSISMLFSGGMSQGFSMLGLLKSFLKYLFPLIAAVTLFKLAWDKNFMGIQDSLKNTVKTVWDSIKLIVDAFTDNTLSEENFLKAKEMGILPLIEGILQLKYHWEFFVEGFKKGLETFFKSLSNVLIKLGFLKKGVTNLGDLVMVLIDKMTAPGMTDVWEKLGYALGNISGWILAIFAALPLIIKAIKVIAGILKIIFTAVKFIVKIIGWLTKIPTILTAIGNAIIYILSLFGIVATLPAWLVGLIATAVVAVVALIIVFWDEICDFFIKIGEIIVKAFITAWEWFSNIPWVQSALSFLKDIINSVVNAVPSIVSFVKDLIQKIGSLISKFIGVLKSILSPIAHIVKSLVLGIWQIIKSVANFVIQLIKVIYEAVRVVVLAIIWVFQKLWNGICTGLSYVRDFFSSVFSWVYSNVIKPTANAIGEAFSWVYNNVISPVISAVGSAFDWLCTNVFQPVGEFFKGVFNSMKTTVRGFYSVVKLVFGKVKDTICTAIQKASDFVTPIIEGISEAISWVADAISSVIDGASKALGWVGEKLSNAGDALSNAIGLSTGGYVKTEGIAVLHPNEVVVNDVLTKGLGSFLKDYSNAKKTVSSPLIQQDIISTDDYKEVTKPDTLIPSDEDDKEDSNSNGTSVPPVVINDYTGDKNSSPMQSLVNNTTTNSTYNEDSSSHSEVSSQDNSVTFETGSIVINIDNNTDLSEEGLDALVDKMMKKMARKLQLRNMQTRT